MKRVDSLAELLDLTALEGVQFFEVRGVLYAGFSDEKPASTQENEEADSDDTQSKYTWQFFIQYSAAHINLRAQLKLRGPDARYTVDAAARFALSEEADVQKSILEQFLNGAAMVVLYPYIREALHETGRKIGAKIPLMPLIGGDYIEIKLGEPEEKQPETEG